MHPRRLALYALALTLTILAASPSLSAGQRRDRAVRDRAFSASNDDWCREQQWSPRQRVFCEVREDTFTSGGFLDVDTGGNGGITIRGGTGNVIRMRARVSASADSEDDARDLASQTRIESGGGRIRLDAPRTRRNENVSVNFEFEVPRNTQLTLNTRNGGIRVEDFTGRADMRTVNGGIALAGVGGDVRGETTNGGISIDLEGARWDGAGLDLETRNGGVTMTVPDNYSAQLEAGTVNGGVNIDFPMTVQGRLTRLDRNISTTLGSGGAPLRVHTVNGGVRIRRR